MIGKRFDINSKKFDQYFSKTDPIDVGPYIQWCKDNIDEMVLYNESEVHDGKGKWSCCPWAGGRHWTFFFIDKNDAIRFKLRWVGKDDE